jgi:nicotinate-nucleotide pyrophosphorylase (carboxylating)
MVAKQYSDRLNIEVKIPDGNKVKVGDIAFIIDGPSIEILSVERLILNIMQRMSAIATLTKRYVDLLVGTRTRVLDTRKTTPGLRALEKWAVRIGGGVNHRMGLYDMIMLKDNHIDFAGGIDRAIDKTHTYLKENNLDIPIEIETRNLDEVSQVIQKGGVQRIMLDNFDYDNTRRAVELIGGKFETESSGGITLETARKYAECGVDYISVGALTHSVHNLDMSLKALE